MAVEVAYAHGPDGQRHYVRRVHADGQVTTLCAQRWTPVPSTSRTMCVRCERAHQLEAQA